MNSISLFSGAGGMDIGFKQAGFQTIAANELDSHACQTLRLNNPNLNVFEGDIKRYIQDLSNFKNIEVIFGGPPCQGFSIAGKMDHDDPRSQLIFSFADAIDLLSPNAFVMENVKALGSLDKFTNVRRELIARFRKSGYSVNMHILNAKDFGVPQSRERVFFIGVKSGFKPINSNDFFKYYSKAPSLREAISHLGKAGSESNSRVCNAKITLAENPILRKSPYAGMLFNGQGRPLNPDGWASTLPASMGGNRTPIIDENHLYDNKPSWVEDYHAHLLKGGKPFEMNSTPNYLRRLTVDEAALLQGFPSDYLFSGPTSRIYSQIGNAVPCKLAKVVALVIKSSLSKTDSRILESFGIGENYELLLN